jgi:hypothetical protein
MGSENAQGCTQNAENGFGFDFLEQYHKDGDEFLSHIVAGDEIWVPFVNFETESSQSSGGTHILKKPKKFKQTSAR